MLLTPEVNGASQELPSMETPEINGARQEVAAVEKYIDGAWQEVWSATKYMEELDRTIRSGSAGATGSETVIWYVTTEEHVGGHVTYFLEGDFENPAVQFDWSGGYTRDTETNTYYDSAGSIDVYLRSATSVESYTAAVSHVGDSTGNQSGTYSNTYNGSYDRIGLRIDLSKWSATNYTYLDYWIDISNILLGGKKAIPAASCAYEY